MQADRGNAFHYPDVAVVRGRPEYLDGRKDTITNPLIIIEVLSPAPKATAVATNSPATGGWPP